MTEPPRIAPDSRLTVHEAADLLGVSGSRVRRLVALGLLPEARRLTAVGHVTILVERGDVERLAREGWRQRRMGRRRAA